MMRSKVRPPVVLTVTETARILKLKRHKVYYLIEDGVVDAFRLKSHWRIRASSVVGLFPSPPLPLREMKLEDTGGNTGE